MNTTAVAELYVQYLFEECPSNVRNAVVVALEAAIAPARRLELLTAAVEAQRLREDVDERMRKFRCGIDERAQEELGPRTAASLGLAEFDKPQVKCQFPQCVCRGGDCLENG